MTAADYVFLAVAGTFLAIVIFLVIQNQRS